MQWYNQCGGRGYDGPTNCFSGSECQVVNDFYSQVCPSPASPSRTPAACFKTQCHRAASPALRNRFSTCAPRIQTPDIRWTGQQSTHTSSPMATTIFPAHRPQLLQMTMLVTPGSASIAVRFDRHCSGLGWRCPRCIPHMHSCAPLTALPSVNTVSRRAAGSTVPPAIPTA